MNDIVNLEPGIYRVFWKTGGYIYAAVGRNASGDQWFTPTNWICPNKSLISSYSEEIDRMELIQEDALTEDQMSESKSLKKIGKGFKIESINKLSVDEMRLQLTRKYVYSASLLDKSIENHNENVILRAAFRQMAFDSFGKECMYDKYDQYIKEATELFEEMSKDE